jgi:hypothetical protein
MIAAKMSRRLLIPEIAEKSSVACGYQKIRA